MKISGRMLLSSLSVASALVCLTGMIFLSACASGPPMGRDKYGVSDDDFAKARYNCMKEASSLVSNASASGSTGGYGASYGANYDASVSSKVMPSCQMYRACMDSQGWKLVPNGRFQQPIECSNP